MTLLPKGNKPREFSRNLRPIFLLNTTYKILSGCIGNRIKKNLDNLIHENQTGFMKNRFIGENTRMLYDIMSYSDKENIPGMALFKDFEKAFDSVSWRFITKTLFFF